MPRKRAANGSGTQPRKRSDGRWEARYIKGTDAEGKPILRYVYGHTALEVAEKLRAATAAIDAGTYSDPQRMTLSAWLDIWLEDYCGAIKPGTLKGYKAIVNNHIRPELGAVRLCDLAPHVVQAFLRGLQATKDLSGKTVHNVHGTLSKALSEALRVHYIASNPAAGAILPKVVREEIKPLDADEILRFTEAIKGNRSEAVFFIALNTGMRLSEILGLRWECVDFETGTITVNAQLLIKRGRDTARALGLPKNGKSRSFKPATAVMDTLRTVRREQREWQLRAGRLWDNTLGLVFTNELGEPVPHATVEHRFTRIMEDLGLSHRFHDLRHTFTVEALRAGIDPKTVSDMLGHASVSFTLDIYAHVTGTMQDAAKNRLDEIIASRKPV